MTLEIDNEFASIVLTGQLMFSLVAIAFHIIDPVSSMPASVFGLFLLPSLMFGFALFAQLQYCISEILSRYGME